MFEYSVLRAKNLNLSAQPMCGPFRHTPAIFTDKQNVEINFNSNFPSNIYSPRQSRNSLYINFFDYLPSVRTAPICKIHFLSFWQSHKCLMRPVVEIVTKRCCSVFRQSFIFSCCRAFRQLTPIATVLLFCECRQLNHQVFNMEIFQRSNKYFHKYCDIL